MQLDLVGDQLAIALAELRETLWLAQSQVPRCMNAARAFLQELVPQVVAFILVSLLRPGAQYDAQVRAMERRSAQRRLDEDQTRVSKYLSGNRVAKARFCSAVRF